MVDSAHFLRRDALVSLRERLSDPDGHHDSVISHLDALDDAIRVAGRPPSSRLIPGLFDLVPVALFIVGESGRVLDANDAAGRLIGRDRAELFGTSDSSLLGRIGSGPTATPANLHHGELLPHGELRALTHADGHTVYCQIHTAASAQHDGTRLWLKVAQDVTSQQQRIEQLHHRANHDELTGLPNRQGLHALLATHLAEGPPTGFAVLFCDIDNFKRVNDSWGHVIGDELLITVARMLADALPHDCRVGRFSGDEFLVTCPDVAVHGGLETFAARVSGILRASLPLGGRLVRISGSVGAAAINGNAATFGDLVRFADAAMFDAKRRGTGRVAIADTTPDNTSTGQLDLEDQLRAALANDGLALHYQPLVDAQGRTTGAEALLRWPHPQRGVLAPDVILPLAEQGDLLAELDRWVLRTALAEAATWPEIDIAVNLSGPPTNEPGQLETLSTLVTDSGIDPHRVILELTETALLELPLLQRHTMGRLAERGVAFAIDDFGTGYSSLARLREMPAQIIKLDRTFLPTTDADDTSVAIIRAIVDLCRATGHHCIAEGVETRVQRDLLTHLGIDAYQGWLFGHPVPAAEFRRNVTTDLRG
ncbi:PAS domain S-box-containing protein/diguanylate cyclase (GGDEF) domain-containing protein [Actinopolyspora lacussalsi subsp. righensis]|uniref:PAS domain S-box-containing protein/diguanylate cyclase (GGDEF) domain-containing protein n=1 Tax=Actinopolyspora righensis TaxID=995060 RepID=A0A1I6ZD04_9ACTN|nr:EAL domain-containing protein [Actinopolyspora righensis]SFT60570.1 PAS domain S-box-containing protein/diguanylate cyclase (GGDEF) domain-containing protein [Actinopolyspora righensis]